MKFLLLLLLLELSLFASIGKISALNGKVVVDRQKQVLDTVIGFDLEEKDIVSTDDKSKVQITLNDGTVLSLGKNSKLDIYEYIFDEKQSNNSKAGFKFVEGTFKSITGVIGKVAPEKFKLETTSATIGIRGTIVVGNQEKIACTHGRIEVTSAGVTQILNAGMMTYTEVGKAPTPPTKIEGSLLKEVEMDSGTKKEESKSTTSETKEKTSEEKSSTNSEISSNSQLLDVTQQNTQTTTINTSLSNLTASIIDKVAQNTITQQVEKEVNNITTTTNTNTNQNLIYLPFYSTNLSFDNEGFTNIVNFKITDNQSSLTIATYGIENSLSAHRLILMKLTNIQNKEYDFISDSFVWTGTENFTNAILNYQDFETNATYGVFISVNPLSCSEDNNGCIYASNNSSKLYFTSTSELEFLNFNESIIKYGYSDSINNYAYISFLNAGITGTENVPKFKILADSKVGTTISTEYGYFVTISDNFNSINYENNEPSLTNITPIQTNVFLNDKENLDGSSWGYWATALNNNNPLIDMKSAWVSGNQVTAPNKYNATFNGQVIGGVTSGGNTGYIKLDSDNVFKATIDVGTATITNSLIQFRESLSNNLWSGTFNTSGINKVNQQEFSSSIVNDSNNIIGALSGKYFGTTNVNITTVQSIGGGFNMSNGGATATGVFKAK